MYFLCIELQDLFACTVGYREKMREFYNAQFHAKKTDKPHLQHTQIV